MCIFGSIDGAGADPFSSLEVLGSGNSRRRLGAVGTVRPALFFWNQHVGDQIDFWILCKYPLVAARAIQGLIDTS